jgi:hypothetical protein
MTRRRINERFHLSNTVVIRVRGKCKNGFVSLPDVLQSILQILSLCDGNLKEIVVGSVIEHSIENRRTDPYQPIMSSAIVIGIGIGLRLYLGLWFGTHAKCVGHFSVLWSLCEQRRHLCLLDKRKNAKYQRQKCEVSLGLHGYMTRGQSIFTPLSSHF